MLIGNELLPLWARKILDYPLDLIRKKSQLNEKGSKYSCNESLTLPDETSDEDTTHGIATIQQLIDR